MRLKAVIEKPSSRQETSNRRIGVEPIALKDSVAFGVKFSAARLNDVILHC